MDLTRHLDNQMKQAGPDWHKPWRANGISRTIQYINEVVSAVSRLLKINLKLMVIAAADHGREVITEMTTPGSLNNTVLLPNLYTTDKIEIAGQGDVECVSRLVQQRSPVWFEMREKFPLGGSTCRRAIGLEGRPKMVTHINQFTKRKPKPPVKPDVQERMDYGSKYEIDAFSTVAGIAMPALFPQYTLVEEGSHRVGEKLLVSPDGGFYNHDDAAKIQVREASLLMGWGGRQIRKLSHKCRESSCLGILIVPLYQPSNLSIK